MASKNDVTGDTIATKFNSQKFVDNWDAIFGKKTSLDEKDSKESEKEVDKKEEGK